MGDAAPFDTLPSAARWMADAGYVGIQIPTWDSRRIDLRHAAESQDYFDELAGTCREAGDEITELPTHLQGQLVALHPVHHTQFASFADDAAEGKPAARKNRAARQPNHDAKADRRL